MQRKLCACSFTGHRPKSFPFGYREEDIGFQELRARIRDAVISVCNLGCRTFYCGMAEGADLWCGEIVLELRDSFDPPLEICAVVPYLSQPEKMTKKNQQRYRAIMESAKERYLVAKDYHKLCFQKRNLFLVDSCDVLIAVLQSDNDRSGTAQTVRMAKKKNKKVILVEP